MLQFKEFKLNFIWISFFKPLGIVLLILIIGFSNGCSNSKDNEIFIQELEYSDNLKIVKRSDWGWKPLENKKEEAEINRITVHHGGVEVTRDKDPANLLKNLQKWSREEKKWIDIPYHFMIDLDGIIYEARPINYPGDTNTEYDPTGHALVEVMGNYEIQTLSDDQMNSMIDLIVFLSKKFNVPISEIKTHKDYSSITVCPGKNIYKYFEDGTIINEVQRRWNKQ